jgi:threonyl-tRNA synthetase
MNQVTITLPDGSSRSVAAGTPVYDIAAAISPRLAKAAVAAFVDERMVDVSYPLASDAKVRILTGDSPDALQP